MRGSIPIQPGQCRGWCDLKNLQFKKLRRKLEKSIKRVSGEGGKLNRQFKFCFLALIFVDLK